MSDQVPGRAPESWSPQTKWMQQFSDEVATLVAEDIRAARNRLGVSVNLAAASASLEPRVYRAIEEGTHSADAMNWERTRLAARRLGLKELRLSYVEDLDCYMKLDISGRGPRTTFVDTLGLDIKKLREEHVWVNPSQVLALLARYDPNKTLRSRRLVDKQLIELWIAAVYTLGCDRGRNYYVSLVESDPPDAEVLAISDAGKLNRISIEITRHGAHSPGLAEVIRKKLRTKLPPGTNIVILVEQAERVSLSDLQREIDHENPHRQPILIVGQSQEPHRFKFATPFDDETSDPEANGWVVTDFDGRDASHGYRGYEGIVYIPTSRFALPHPVFVKNLVLDGQPESRSA